MEGKKLCGESGYRFRYLSHAKIDVKKKERKHNTDIQIEVAQKGINISSASSQPERLGTH